VKRKIIIQFLFLLVATGFNLGHSMVPHVHDWGSSFIRQDPNENKLLDALAKAFNSDIGTEHLETFKIRQNPECCQESEYNLSTIFNIPPQHAVRPAVFVETLVFILPDIVFSDPEILIPSHTFRGSPGTRGHFSR
jgi:hypothetical protein